MKTITNEGQDLTSISTVVYYSKHPFLPLYPPTGVTDREELIRDSTSSGILGLSDNMSSDLIDFAEYNFSYKLDKPKYKEYLPANYFDTRTLDLLGGHPEFEVLNQLSGCIFPQGSSQVDNDPSKFFGMISVSNQSIVLLDVPGEERGINDEVVKKGIYKVEVYNAQVTGNNTLSPGFIEQDTLLLLGQTPTISPALTIVFGPSEEMKNNPSSMYYPWGTYSDNRQKETVTSTEWKDLTEEVTSRKVTYIVVSSDGTLRDINLSYAAFGMTPNPNRNQPDYSLRNDYFDSTKDAVDVLGSYSGSRMIHDKVSHTLIGTKETNLTVDCPVIGSKLLRAESLYSPFSSYQEGESVMVNGRTWVSSIGGNIGQDPEYSPFWTLGPDEEGSTGSSDYIHLFVSSNGLDKGIISPIGSITTKKDSKMTFTVTPGLGYNFPIGQDIAGGSESTNLITLNDVPYPLTNLTSLADSEVTLTGLINSGNIKFYFNPIESSISFVMYVDADWIGGSGEEKYYTYPVWPEGVRITTYVGGVLKELTSSGLLMAVIESEVSVHIETVNSEYVITGIYQNGDQSAPIEQTEPGWFKFPVNFESSSYQISLTTKLYECKVTKAVNVEVDKLGEYLNYGENFVLQFYGETGKTLDTVKVYYAKTGQEVTEAGKYIVTSDFDLFVLTINNVTEDFNIEITFKD